MSGSTSVVRITENIGADPLELYVNMWDLVEEGSDLSVYLRLWATFSTPVVNCLGRIYDNSYITDWYRT